MPEGLGKKNKYFLPCSTYFLFSVSLNLLKLFRRVGF